MSSLTTTSALSKTAWVAAASPVSQSKQWLSVLPSRSVRITGASGSSAFRTSMTGSRMSYSTSISSSASRAAYRSSATTKATSWPWKRTLSVASTACTSLDRVGIQARPFSASMAPVTTSFTFGCACATVVSMLTIRACAIGARRIGQVQHAGQLQVVDVAALAADEARVLLAQHPAVPDGLAVVVLERRLALVDGGHELASSRTVRVPASSAAAHCTERTIVA